MLGYLVKNITRRTHFELKHIRSRDTFTPIDRQLTIEL